MQLVFGRDADVAKWVAKRIPCLGGTMDFGPCATIGVVKDGKAIAGVVYHEYRPQYSTMAVSLAAEDARWATRGNLRAILYYPFETVGIYTLWSITPHKNERALKFNKGLGFVHEGTLAHRFGKGQHAISARMCVPEYRKLLDRFAARERVSEAA